MPAGATRPAELHRRPPALAPATAHASKTHPDPPMAAIGKAQAVASTAAAPYGAAMAKLEFFWDVVSPYTYLAFTQLDGLRERSGAELLLRPFLVGGVFKATGNEMPARLPAKAKYMMQDLARWRDAYAVPLKLPGETPFPINSLLPMRAAMAAEAVGAQEVACRALFDAYWGRGVDVSGAAELAEVLAGAGLDGDGLLAAAATQGIKDALRANTDEAVARGAFGAPAMFVGEALFWGNDRLAHVETALGSAP